MSENRIRLSNGLRIAVFVGLATLFGQLAVVIWGAATLNARVTVVETNHVALSSQTRIIQKGLNGQAVDIAEMRVQLKNIDNNIERLLDQ